MATKKDKGNSSPQEKIAKTEEETENQEEVVEDVKYAPLDILSVIKNAQSQNGLKHGDYKRYRHYCTERLKRIRKGVKFTYGRGKFVKKTLSLENINEFKDPRILQIPLYNAERAWAYAMSLKQELSTNRNADPRIRMHIRGRFAKALKWAQLLKVICQKHTEEKTALEAEAYAEYLEGVYNFETEEWEAAFNNFVRSRKIYDEMSKVSDSLQKILYQEKIEQIDQSIRYCNFKRGKETLDQDSLRSTNDPTLTAQMEKIMAEKMQQNVKNSAEVVYHGKSLPIKNEKTLLAMQKIDELSKTLSKLDSSKLEVDEESGESSSKLNSYIEIFSAYDEAIKNTAKEKEEYKAMGEAHLQINILMSNYFQSRKLATTIERNSLLIHNACNKFEKDIGFDSVWNCKKNYKGKTFFPQDIVKLYDNILQIYKQLLELESSNPDYKSFKAIELQESCYRALRCFYVACTHFSYGKLVEGYSLLVHFDDLSKSIQDLERNYEISLEQINRELLTDLKVHRERLSSLKVRAHINILNQRNRDEDKLKKDQEVTAGQGTIRKNENLFQYLKRAQKDDTDNQIPDDLDSMPLIEFPPSVSLLPSKPIFLDLGYNYLRYPSLKGKIKEEESKGLGKVVKNVFGFFKKS